MSPAVRKLARRLAEPKPVGEFCELGEIDQAKKPLHQVNVVLMAIEGLASRSNSIEQTELDDLHELLSGAMDELYAIQVPQRIARKQRGDE